MTDPHDAVAELFRAFADAVARADAEAFRRLCVQDVEPQEALFLRNARAVAESRVTLRLRRIHQRGTAAELTFDLVKADGSAAGESTLTASQEAEGWRIRGL